DLAECAALLDAANRGELDAISPPPAPLDVLAQQIVAEVAATGECDEEALYRQTISAWPYRGLTRAAFDATVRMLAAGFTTRRGRRGAHLHRDAVHGKLRPRASARLTALTNGGVIPDQFDCDVLLSPAGLRIGSLNEDFAFETLPGDIFQLGNHAYRILRNEAGKLWVEDARGAPPNIPFWFGEAPGRTDELSAAVSRLRAELDPMLAQGQDATRAWLVETYRVPSAAAHQLADYYGAARAALGALPTQETIVLERFFDEVGDLHLVVHSPFGSRLNRAWGLALRKRFCRKFNFELQAAALEDSIVLSLGETHSFVLEEVARYLHSATARAVLTQAALDAPVFGNRWRWNVTTALAVRRSRNGKRAPPQFQRSDAEDLMAVIFPDQLACAENLAGEREIPDHPLVTQTIRDCLEDTMDATGLEALLARLEAGEIQIMARDLPTPSPLAEEIINARNYAFLDDGAAEERRTRAVRSGGYWDANDLTAGQLDPAAIAKLREQAWPQARDAEELHDALVIHGFLAESEAAQNEAWTPLFAALCAEQRATAATLATGQSVWVAAERLQALRCLCADPTLDPPIEAVCDGPPPEDASAALCELLRGRLQALGPVTVRELAAPLALDESAISAALAQLEREGFAIQGHFSPDAEAAQWCERRLLARIHRYTVQRRRREIQTVSPQTYMRFLLAWHGVGHARSEGEAALADAVAQLEGYCLPAAAWETEVLPARIADYHPQMLDRLCAGGRVAWLRLRGPQNGQGAAPL
ncbi:MAG: hypothetical protein L0H83_13710, partial [Salinisphaera sp.]|nr:hypothetical protein [Salinisphaera sp.]